MARVRELGANVSENVELSTADELFKYDGKSIFYEISCKDHTSRVWIDTGMREMC